MSAGVKTPPDVAAKIVALYRDGIEYDEITRQTNISLFGIQRVLKRAGIPCDRKHQRRQARKAVPTDDPAVYRLALPSGEFVLVDADIAEKMARYCWHMGNSGYARAKVKPGKHVILHRFIMGDPPSNGLMVDHINRDRLDNRRANLRWVTATENARNQDKEAAERKRQETLRLKRIQAVAQ